MALGGRAWGRGTRRRAFATEDHKALCSANVGLSPAPGCTSVPCSVKWGRQEPFSLLTGESRRICRDTVQDLLPGDKEIKSTARLLPSPEPELQVKTVPSGSGEAPCLPREGGREGLTRCFT